ncbi:hypothetical protein ACFQ0B_44805 [Nonomuraea thailandensis]
MRRRAQPHPRLGRHPFPGTVYPEVNRLAQVTLPDAVTVLGNGDLDVPGFGTIRAGFTRTDQGLLGVGSSPGSRSVSSTPSRTRPPSTTTTSR